MQGFKPRGQLTLFVAGSLEQFVPKSDILYRVNRVLDLSWLHDAVSEFYCADQGRPGLDAEVLVRLMLAGMFRGITSDRALLRAARTDVAIRWFIGYELCERLPHHSSLTRTRQRWGEAFFREIFLRGVHSCMKKKAARGQVVHVDASLIRANASWARMVDRHVDEVERENRPKKGKKRGGRSVKVSETDPDARLGASGCWRRPEPSYKQHAVVDDERGVVVDVTVTRATVDERDVIASQLDAVRETTGAAVERVTADRGYAYAKVYGALERRGIDAVIPARRSRSGVRIPLGRFRYDARRDVAKCPRGKTLRFRRERAGSRVYVSRKSDCAGCALRGDCLGKNRSVREWEVPADYPALLRARRRRWGEEEKRLYGRHLWLSEGYHGEAKNRHGLARAMRRGLSNMRIQSYLTATVVNLKRLVSAFEAGIYALWRAKFAPKRRLDARGVVPRPAGFLPAAA